MCEREREGEREREQRHNVKDRPGSLNSGSAGLADCSQVSMLSMVRGTDPSTLVSKEPGLTKLVFPNRRRGKLGFALGVSCWVRLFLSCRA